MFNIFLSIFLLAVPLAASACDQDCSKVLVAPARPYIREQIVKQEQRPIRNGMILSASVSGDGFKESSVDCHQEKGRDKDTENLICGW